MCYLFVIFGMFSCAFAISRKLLTSNILSAAVSLLAGVMAFSNGYDTAGFCCIALFCANAVYLLVESVSVRVEGPEVAFKISELPPSEALNAPLAVLATIGVYLGGASDYWYANWFLVMVLITLFVRSAVSRMGVASLIIQSHPLTAGLMSGIMTLVIPLLNSKRSMSAIEALFLLSVLFFALQGRTKRKELSSMAVVALLAFSALVLANGAPSKLAFWSIMPTKPYSSGYQLNQFSEIVENAGIVGCGHITRASIMIPESASVFSIARVFSAFGWLGFALVIVCASSVVSIVVSESRTLGERGHAFVLMAVAPFAISAVASVMYVMHLVPIYWLPFPFISQGISATLPALALPLAMSVCKAVRALPEGHEAHG